MRLELILVLKGDEGDVRFPMMGQDFKSYFGPSQLHEEIKKDAHEFLQKTTSRIGEIVE